MNSIGYNHTTRCVPIREKNNDPFTPNKVIAVVLPQSDKALGESELDEKIGRLQKQVDLLGAQLETMSLRNTHGGKKFRSKKISVENQEENVLGRLEFLKKVQADYFPKKEKVKQKLPKRLVHTTGGYLYVFCSS